MRPNYNDLRSADDAADADDGDGVSEEQGSQVNISMIVAVNGKVHYYNIICCYASTWHPSMG